MIIQFWIWSPRNTRKTPSYPASASLCLLRGMPCATLHSVVSVYTDLHLSPLSSACSCASTRCRSSSHCVSWLSESSTSVLSANVLRRNTHFRLILPRVACHQDIVFSFRLLSKLRRTPPIPTWSSPKPCCPVSPGPQETAQIFDSSWRLVLAATFLNDGILYQYQPICTPRHSSSLQSNICDTSC